MKRNIMIKGCQICDGETLVCVPVSGTSFEEVMFEIRKVCEAETDVIEWRADYYNEDIIFALPRIKKLMEDRKLLFTFRTKSQGGKRENAYYFDLLKQVIMNGNVDMIDIELCENEKAITEIVELAKAKGITTIISEHFFENTPSKEEIKSKYDLMEKLGADIPKVAVMPQDFKDVCTMMETVYEVSRENSPIIGISMDTLGTASRVACKQMGSCMCFATVLSASAPGQLSVKLVRELFEKLK
ncbi:MAG: type I 3-dehydroquinate dehydratase [Clostridia bacterium]